MSAPWEEFITVPRIARIQWAVSSVHVRQGTKEMVKSVQVSGTDRETVHTLDDLNG